MGYLQELKVKLKMNELPIEWEQKLKIIESNFFNERIQLSSFDKEYKDIETEYKRTNGKGHILRVERIQNFHLWRRFVGEK